MKVLSIAVLALINTQAINLVHPTNSQQVQVGSKNMHACDFVDDAGEEIDTSLALQLNSEMRLHDDEDSVQATRDKLSLMQEEMDQKIAVADQNRKDQAAKYKARQNEPDSEGK